MACGHRDPVTESNFLSKGGTAQRKDVHCIHEFLQKKIFKKLNQKHFWLRKCHVRKLKDSSATNGGKRGKGGKKTTVPTMPMSTGLLIGENSKLPHVEGASPKEPT